MKRKDAIIFDMDGVLINTRSSYLKVVEITVERILRSRIDQRDIAILTNTIGYNNLWDVSYAIIKLIQKGIKRERWSQEALKLLPINRYGEEYRRIYQTFQTVYLGSKNYEIFENEAPTFQYNQGLINAESLLISRNLIKDLKVAGYKIGIATGRPYMEALLGLKLQNLLGKDYFNAKYIVGFEDTKRVKPNPDPLLEVQKRLNSKNPIYIGDGINDVEASRRANIPCMYINFSDEQIQRQALAKFIKVIIKKSC